MISAEYPKGKALLGAFRSYPRYAGAREAVFHALCRKNFGCSHFLVEEDDIKTGVPLETRELFEQLGDIGIAPVYTGNVQITDGV